MNVKIVNKYASLLANLDVDFIKSVEGEFTPEEIIMQFQNFFFNKMILDITAIKNYEDITKIQELSVNMDMSKVILLLDDSEVVNSPRYLSQLVSMGIYNFTRNVDAIKFLIDNPNSYKDVAQYHQLNNVMVTNDKKIEEETSGGKSSAPTVIYEQRELRVIGIKNVTEHAGSTTLTYLLKKQLEKKYKVVAVEVDDNDFMYLNDKTLKHTNHLELQNFIASNYNLDVILVDLNDKGSESACTEVLYLIEPGLIKLNKLIRKDRNAFEKLKGKKIILNRSVLNNADIADFEYESRSKVYYNIPYVDDKLENNHVLNELLIRMGFARLDEENSEKGGKLFSIFK
ncbi:MAG TPA: hypothetical protein K8V91_09845 [[Clostridium] spiroforme]|uniref:Uncharacterized protein n=1 Tax=Thomasclavelia spiroformis TaxID=29348 RepID=A0A921KK26_9FIRM|nr:hypothetical protein [Thomasclavelia spiroformis]